MKFETKAIWVGQAADKATGATIAPIYQTSTFTREEVMVCPFRQVYLSE